METTNLSKIRREKMLNTINEIKKNIKDEEIINNLSLIENELTKKKYGLIWEEHEERVDKELKTKIPVFEELTNKSILKNNEKYNFLLEGDNLHSLYLLEKTHKNKIDVIYIDPPYNTGKEFVYNDNIVDEFDGYSHSKWLSFMKRRLTLAHKLLADDGIIMISINESEQAQLKILMDEIFDNNNLLSVHHIQTRYSTKNVANNGAQWLPIIEYVYIYAKNIFSFKPNLPVDEYDLSPYHFKIEEINPGKIIEINGKKVEILKKGDYKIIDCKESNEHLLKEVWASGSLLKQKNTAAWYYDNYLLNRLSEDGVDTLYKIYNMGEDGLGYRYVKSPQKLDKTRGKVYQGVPTNKKEKFENGNKASKSKPIINYYDFSPDFGNIVNEGGVAFNSGKKPIKMLKKLINYHKNKNATVLDFFAGSGSTAHAVLDLNNEDGGHRNFIICTNNENNICEKVTYTRLLNVINGYGKYKGLECNLKYYKTSFIPRFNTDEENLSQNLMINIKNLIQLENGIEIDGLVIRVILTEEEIDKFTTNDKELNECEKLYISSDILLTSKQNKILNDYNIELFIIPEYYFEDEIKEVA